MAKMNLNIHDSILDRVIDSYVYLHGYTDQVEDEDGESVDNPVSKQQYFKLKLAAHIKKAVAQWEAKKAHIDKRKDLKTQTDQMDIRML